MSEQVQAGREGGVWRRVRSWSPGRGGGREAVRDVATDTGEDDHGGWRMPGCRK